MKWTYPLSLLALFGVVFVVLGIAPWYRQDWLLENLLVFAALAFLIATHRSLRFTNLSYTLLFAFWLFHEIGAHYTYSLVPYDIWITKLTGSTLAERDHRQSMTWTSGWRRLTGFRTLPSLSFTDQDHRHADLLKGNRLGRMKSDRYASI